MKTISFVLPVYNEEETIHQMHEALLPVLGELSQKYNVEAVFVNDGSHDASLEKLVELQNKDSRVAVVNFSRNFGHQAAITAGVDFAKGDAIVVMDSDLQDPPAVALDLIKKWEEGYEVVYAQRHRRKDALFKRFTAYVFYRIFHVLSDVEVPNDTGDFRLLDKKPADVLRNLRESSRYVRGLTAFVGFKQTGVLFNREDRRFGVTKYPLRKMVQFALDAILGFSTVPLKLISKIGLGVTILSVLGIVYALLMKFFFPQITVSGWTLMIIAIFFIGGVQTLMIGILGAYVGRTYQEVKRRPLYIVSSVLDSKNAAPGKEAQHE